MSKYSKYRNSKRWLAGFLAGLLLLSSIGTDWNTLRYTYAEELYESTEESVTEDEYTTVESEATTESEKPAMGMGIMGDETPSDDDEDELYILQLGDSPLSVVHSGSGAVDWNLAYKLPYGRGLSVSEFRSVSNINSSKSADVTQLYYCLYSNIIYENNDISDSISMECFMSNPITTNTILPVGEYAIFFDDGNNSALGIKNDDRGGIVEYVLKIEETELGKATGLSWNTSTKDKVFAEWEPVTVDSNDRAITASTNLQYKLKLYYDEEKEAFDEIEVENGVFSVDLYSDIISSGKGFGNYYFEVVASEKVDAKGKANYTEVVSDKSVAYHYSDTVKPIISSYTIDEKDDGTRILKGIAKDDGTGIAAYAFSSKEDADSLADNEWITVENPSSNIGKDFECTVDIDDVDAGHIYFYVKDQDNNCSVMKKTTDETNGDIYITVITSEGYYVDSANADYEKHLLNNETLTLPVKDDMKKIGFIFEGWYKDKSGDDFVGDAITEIVPGSDGFAKGEEHEIFAKWVQQEISFSKNPEDVSRPFDGTATELEAEIDEMVTYSTISWQWYRKANESATAEAIGTPVTGVGSVKYEVKDVADSGLYYATATITIPGADEPISTDSSVATVSITSRKLNLVIKDAETHFSEAAPEFEFDFGDNSASDAGLAGEDAGKTATELFGEYAVNIKTDYTIGNAVGTYSAYYDTDAASIAMDNYAVAITSGTLTVLQADLSKIDRSKITVVLEKTDAEETETKYVYDKTAKEPAVISVTLSTDDGNIVLGQGSESDFTVGYWNNTNANQDDTAVVITFVNNYTGEIREPFYITRASYDVNTIVTGWKYGEYDAETNGPSVDTQKDGEVTFYYLETTDLETTDADMLVAFENLSDEDKAKAVTVRPEDAGRYYVWAVIGATTNYDEIVAAPSIFTIEKRHIILKTDSATWAYDANMHTKATYTVSGDGFVHGGAFQFVSVTGQIKDIGSVDNTCEYKLTSTTDPDGKNYEIEVVLGTLTVNETKLETPTTFAWSKTEPGSVEWIAITRDDLNVSYEVTLYRTKLSENGEVLKDDSGNIVYEKVEGSTRNVTGTSVSYIDEILADSAEVQYGYTADIKVIPVYGAEDKPNYVESDASPKLNPKYTVKVDVEIPDELSDKVSEFVVKDASNNSVYSQVCFQGQTVNTICETVAGFHFYIGEYSYSFIGNDDGILQYNAGKSYYSNWPNGTSSKTGCFDISNAMLFEPRHIVIHPVVYDTNPFVRDLNYYQGEKDESVVIKATLHDYVGLSAYSIVKVAKEDSSYDYSDITWIPIKKEDGKAPLSYQITKDIKEAGVYYVVVKDTDGNWAGSDPVVVYSITFDGNGADNASDEPSPMPTLFKLKDTTIEIPANKFTRAGYGFTNWTGATGIYANNGLYLNNANDTLKAGWTDKKVTYNVRYFYQNLTETKDEDGKLIDISAAYVEATPAEFTSAYGAVINYANKAIRADKKGYTLTSTPEGIDDYQEEITATEDGQEIRLYYNLNKYKITYTYTDTDGKTVKKYGEDEYYYGQTVNEEEKPSAIGYSFVGWNWGDVGQAPATMPSNSLTVTGYFAADHIQYYVEYYLQNLDQTKKETTFLSKSFECDTAREEVITANFGETLNASLTKPETASKNATDVVAREINGFTVRAVEIHYGNKVTKVNGEDFDFDEFMQAENAANDTATGTVQKHFTDEELAALDIDLSEYKNGPTYICFYYERNIYEITLDVYKDARESAKHLFGSYYDGTGKLTPNGVVDTTDDGARWRLPYGYVFAPENSSAIGDHSDGKDYKASYFENYGYQPLGPSVTQEDGSIKEGDSINWTKRWPESEASKDKYYLASFIDWSTGDTRPEYMPAGNAAITREYASAEKAKYRIEVYYETIEGSEIVSVTDDSGVSRNVTLEKATGTYEKVITYERYGDVGTMVKLVDSTAGLPTDDGNTYIQIGSLVSTLDYHDYYEHNPANDLCEDESNPNYAANHELLSAVVTENKKVNNETTGIMTLRVNLVRKVITNEVRYYADKQLFATNKMKGKWGTSYLVDQLYYFDGETAVHSGGTISDSSKIVDFRSNKYVLSHYGRYYLKDDGHWFERKYYDPAHGTGVTASTKPYSLNAASVLTSYIGRLTSDYVNVYYSSQEVTKHYLMRMKYEHCVADGDDWKQSESSAYMVVKSETYPELAPYGSEFQVYVANACDIFDMTPGIGDDLETKYERYPGAAYLHENGDFKYEYKTEGGEQKLQSGFVAVDVTYTRGTTESSPGTTVAGKFYLYNKGTAEAPVYATDENGYVMLFAADTVNQYYNGNQLSLNYNNKFPAHIGRERFTEHVPTYGRVVEVNNGTTEIYIDGIVPVTIDALPKHDFTAYYYNVYNDFYLEFIYDGKHCTGCKHHDLAYKQQLELKDMVCNTFSCEEGSHIVWYMDEDYTVKLHPIAITGPTRIYGRKEKDPVENNEYAFYKLPEKYPALDNKLWVNISDLAVWPFTDCTSSGAITGSGFEKLVRDVEVEYVNEFDEKSTYSGKETEWYYDGLILASLCPSYSMTYQEFSMDYTRYEVPGYEYDDTDTRNKSKAYVTTTPVNMYAYYKCSEYNLTVRRNNALISNDEVSTRFYGSTISLEDPEKKGYIFNGWILKDAGTGVELNKDDYKYSYVVPTYDSDGNIKDPGTTLFRMPACNTIATADWIPDEIELTVTHMLQDNSKTYNIALLDTAEEILSGEAGSVEDNVSVYIDGSESPVSAKVLSIGDVFKALAVSDGSGKTYYYSKIDTDGSKTVTETAYLFAITEELSSVKSEQNIKVEDCILDISTDIFGYSFTNYAHEKTQLVLGADDSFEAYLDATVVYYYTRSSSILIRTLAYAIENITDETIPSGVALSGGGEHYYGESVNLFATMQPNGYSFLGWFKAEDVLEGYEFAADGSRPDDLAAYKLKADIVDASGNLLVTPVFTEENNVIVAKNSADYVVITSAGEPAKPSITVKSNRILTDEEAAAAGKDKVANPYYYGYAQESTNSFTATINWGADGQGTNSIEGYKWYYKYYAPGETVPDDIETDIATEDMTPIANSNSGTVLFGTGNNAGTYVYRCVVDNIRTDNNRRSQVHGSYKFDVLPNNTYYSTSPVSYMYSVDPADAHVANKHAYYEYKNYSSGDYNPDITYYYSKKVISADILAEDLAARLALDENDDNKIYTNNIEFADVLVDETDESKPVIPHIVYYYADSNTPNYADITGSETVEITPAPVTVIAKSAFTKYYDASASVKGVSFGDDSLARRWVGNHQTYSDFKRLQLGSMVNSIEPELKLPNAVAELDHYQIKGILACDADLKVVLNFKAAYDYDGHVGATCVTLTDLWIAQTDLYEVTNNYNYRFINQDRLEISGQIKPYPLEVEWKPSEASEDDKPYSFENHDYDYNYTGTEQKPVVIITDEHTPDPKEYFNVVVRNGQKNVGQYLASAEVIESENLAAHYRPSDYSFSLTGQKYQIISRYILALPKDVTKIYNGQPQTQIKNDEVNEFRFFTKEKESDSWTEYAHLPAGEDFTVTVDKTRTNVGTEKVKVTKITIRDNATNVIINDNYKISFTAPGHEYGTLTIAPCPVIVASGITAQDKAYDGKKDAVVSTADAVFARIATDYDGNYIMDGELPQTMTGLYGSDALSIGAAKTDGVYGEFVNARAGVDKTVDLMYDNSGADSVYGFGGALKGKSAGNYRLVTEYSQDKATATIFNSTKVTIGISDMTMVYGESLSLADYKGKLTYSGFVEPDDESLITGYADAEFVIKKKNGSSYETVAADGTNASVVSKLDAGTYYVFLQEKADSKLHEVEGLASDDYTITWNNTPATLVINKRPVGIAAKEVTGDDVISKTYDGNKDVEADVVKTTTESGYKYYEFTKVSDNDTSGRVNDDDLCINTYTAQYDSEKASVFTDGAKLVNVTAITLGGTKASNYTLDNNAIDINAKITQVTLTIRVNNATTVYGKAAPVFTYNVTGALESEAAAIKTAIAANTELHCAYDTEATGADIANRNVGKYKITVDAISRYENKNYTIVWEDGDTEGNDGSYGYLTVNKRKVYFKAKDATINYGKENPPSIFEGLFVAGEDTEEADDGFVYNEKINTLKTLTSDFIVPEGSIELYSNSDYSTAITENYALTFTCYEDKTAATPVSVSSKTPFGKYDIDPSNVSGFVFAKNYEFISKPGTLAIEKYYMVIDNVEVLGKIYDGTTDVTDDHILCEKKTVSGYSYPGLVYTYYEDATPHIMEYVDNEEFLNSLEIKCEYESAEVNDEAPVKVSISIIPGSYLDKRYILVTANNHAAAAETGEIFEDAESITQTRTIAFIIGTNGEKINRSILKRPITFYPTDKEILYGENITIALAEATGNVSVVKDVTGTDMGFAGKGAKKENFATIGFTLGSRIFETTLDAEGRPVDYRDADTNPLYIAGSDVGSYAMDISSSTVDPVKAKNYEDPEYMLGLLTVKQNTLTAPTVTWDATVPGRINWTAVPAIGKVNVDHYELELFNNGVKVGETVSTTDNGTLTSDAFISVIHAQEAGGKYTVKVKAIASETDNSEYKNVKREGSEGTTAAPKYSAKVITVFDTDADTTEATTDAASKSSQIESLASYIMIAGEKEADLVYTWGRLNTIDGNVYKTGYMVKSIASSSGKLSLGSGTGDDIALTGRYENSVDMAATLDSAEDITVTLTLEARPAGITKTVVTETHDPARYILMFTYSAADTAELEANAEHGQYSTESGYVYEYSWYVKRGTKTVSLGEAKTDAKRFTFPLNQTYYNPYLVYCTIKAIRKDNGKEATRQGSAGITVIKFKPDSANAVSISAEGWMYGESRADKILYTKRIEGIGDPDKDHLEYRPKGSGDSAWTSEVPTDVGTYETKAVIAANDNYDGVDSVIREFTITANKLTAPTGVTMEASSTAPYGLFKWEAVDGPEENAGATGDSKSHIDVKYSVNLSYVPTGQTKSVSVKTIETTDCEYDFSDAILHPGKYSITITACVNPRADQSFANQDVNNCANSEAVTLNEMITIGAEITSNIGGFSKVYDGKKLTLTVEYSAGEVTPAYQWMKNGKVIEGATNNTYSIEYVNETASYSCRVVPDERHPDANIVHTKTVKATITKRPIVVTTATDSKTYDGSALTNDGYTLTYYGDATKDALGSDDFGTADTSTCDVYGSVTFVSENATGNNRYKDLVIKHGDVVVFSADGGTNNCYEIKQNKIGTLTINKREINITANSYEWTYDGNSHSYNTDKGGDVIAADDVGYVITDTDDDKGLASTDHVASIVFTGSIQNITAANKRADGCGVVANVPSSLKLANDTSDVTGNYTIKYASGRLVLKPQQAGIVINHADLLSKTYDKVAVLNPTAAAADSVPENKA
ncbi:MAG: InlB B-repeat-containing protein, partial [Lachnospiraceae bacterium]|nr:InlB B-repeat-containing protein [Candidatus Colinaster scatohippi]